MIFFFTEFAFSQITSRQSGNWSSTTTWNGGSVPGTNDQVVISNGTTVTINTNAVCRNLTIGTGSGSTATLQFDNSTRTLDVSSSFLGDITISGNGVLASTSGVSQTIFLTGDFTNNGTFTQGTNNTVTFDGSSNRIISGNNITFYNLTINSFSSVSLSNNITVNNTLTLSSGLLYTTNDTLTVNGNISVSSPSATKMIVLDDGTNQGRLKLKAASNQSYVFPVGDTRSTDEYSPVTITLTSGANALSYLSVNLKNQKDPNNSSPTNYLNRMWVITPFELSSVVYGISLTYTTADVTGTESQLYFGKYDSGVWTLLGQPNTTTNTFTTTGLTSFSTFTGGEAGSLPVNLQSLYYSVSGRDATINWITTSENNNSGFDVMRTLLDKNGNEGNYVSAGFVKGNGTTSEHKSYSFSDRNLSTGNYKYKLKQIDNNGNFEYFSLNGIVEIGLPKQYSVSQNYPNPFNPTTKIDFELPSDSKVTMTIYDMSGKEVSRIINNEFMNAGYHSLDFNAGKLSSGIYFYRLNANNFSVTKKMMLIK